MTTATLKAEWNKVKRYQKAETPSQMAGSLLMTYIGKIGSLEHANLFAKEEAEKGVSDFWATVVSLLENAD